MKCPICDKEKPCECDIPDDEFTSSHEDEYPELGGENLGGASPLQSADDDTDGSIVDQLYKNPKHKPNQGEGANTWET